MKRLPMRKYVETLKYLRVNLTQREGVYPFYASFKITNICGLKCPFCDIWKNRTEDRLSARDVFRVMDNLAQSSILTLCFEGGEPFLRKDIVELLKYGRGMPYYTALVTSGQHIDKYPIDECYRYLDFLHISIDEGHENLHLYNRLSEFKRRWHLPIIVQIVVTDKTMSSLERKIRAIYESEAKACVMPAAHLDLTENEYPDPVRFRSLVSQLRRRYPRTIITAEHFLRSITNSFRWNTSSCTTSSVIIDSDGGLYYPCRTLMEKPVNLLEEKLMDFLSSDEAKRRRRMMRKCRRGCGWYQYFAVSFADLKSLPIEIRDIILRIEN